jgi:hypothetical protein
MGMIELVGPGISFQPCLQVCAVNALTAAAGCIFFVSTRVLQFRLLYKTAGALCSD